MVIWWRFLQLALVAGIILGIAWSFGYVYDTTNYYLGLLVIINGGIVSAIMLVTIVSIQEIIKNRKRK